MYVSQDNVPECYKNSDIHQFFPIWIAAPCSKSSSSDLDIPAIFVATLLVVLMCGAVCLAIHKHYHDQKSLNEWVWKDRLFRKATVQTPTSDFWRLSNRHTLNPFGVEFEVSTPPATPSGPNLIVSPPPSFHVVVPPPPSYTDCVINADGVNCV